MQFYSLMQIFTGVSLPIATMRLDEPVLPLRILSHNIRYATLSPSTNEKPWPERLPLILNALSYNTRHLDGYPTDLTASNSQDITGAAFICLQEVLHNQLYDILLGLNGIEPSTPGFSSETLPEGPIWAHIGVAREDGQMKGEYSPILYPIRTFKLLHFENLWLSPTPEHPSKGWDATSIRILTLGVFEHRQTGKLVIACCTHLDNDGGESREKGVGIILDKIQHIRETWHRDLTCNNTSADGQDNSNIPVFLAGDFNSFPDQEAYITIQDSDLMCDLSNHVEPKKRYGEEITFTGFDPEKEKDERGRIDFIWLGPKEVVVGSGDLSSVGEKAAGDRKDFLWRVDGYAVLPNLFENNVYSSDHRCVVGDVSLRLSLCSSSFR